jgi:hypothetical protein
MAIPRKKKGELFTGLFVYDSQQNEWVAVQAGTSGGLHIESEQYNVRKDDAGSGITYYGWAATGTATSSATWRIMKMDKSADPDFSITWADGNDSFDNVWDNRASLSYS